MTTTPVHGLPKPPDGCEWHLGYPREDEPGAAHRTLSIVARRKWEPTPGDPVEVSGGLKRVFVGDVSEYEATMNAVLYDPSSGAVFRANHSEIIGPWEEPEPVLSNAGTACDNQDGPCACGAWHSGSSQRKN